MDKKGFILVISAPSGTGKTTVVKKLLQEVSEKDIVQSISVTSRPKRAEEQNGVDYIFVNEDMFNKMINEDKFVEWARVHGHLYGTPKDPLEKYLKEGKIVICAIDVQGGKRIKEKYPRESVLVFLVPPSFEILKKRLLSRSTESPEEIERRLKTAEEEYKKIPEYDYLVVNDKIEEAIEQIKAIIMAERCRITRLKNFEMLNFINP